MISRSGISFFAILFGVFGAPAFAAQEVPQSFTLDGKLYSDASTGTPLVGTGALKIQIVDSLQTCVLYEETQSYDTTLTDGAFNIQVGEATSPVAKRSGGDSGHALADVFLNDGTLLTGKLASNGNPCTGSGAAGSLRYVRITVTPTSGSPRVLAPNLPLSSIPSAMVAENAQALSGKTASQFIQANTSAPAALSQANLENIFSTTNYSKLTDLLAGNSAAYVKAMANNSIQIPSSGATPSTPVAGQLWYESGVLKYWDGAAPQTIGTSGGVTNLVIGTGLSGGTITSSGTIALSTATQNGLWTGDGTNVWRASGKVGVGTNNPAVAMDLKGNTDALGLPSGTTAERPSSPVNGYTRYNTDMKGVEAYVNGAWHQVASGVSPTASEDGMSLRWNETAKQFQWFTAGAAGSGIGTLNGLTNTSQNFAIGTGGPNPHIDSVTSTHTLHIPMAATGGVTAGLLSKTEYDSFNAKLGTATTFAGDVSGTYDNTSVDKIKGKTVTAAPTLDGQVLRYNGTNLVPAFISMFDLRSTVTGSAAFGGVGCLNNQTLTWTAATDNLACSNISLPAGQVTGVLPVANGGTGTNALPATFVLNGGQNGAVIAGTNDANDLTLKTTNLPRVTILANGNVGVGSSVPNVNFEVAGTDQDTKIRVVNMATSLTGRYPGFEAINYSGATGTSSGLNFLNYRGSLGTPAAVQAWDSLGYIGGMGGTGNNWDVNTGAYINFYASENFTPTHAGGGIDFWTTPIGTTGAVLRMRIAENGGTAFGTYSMTNGPPANGIIVSGDVGIATPNPAPSSRLTVNGAIAIGESAAPPQTLGFGKIYVKTDHILYYKDEAGNESNLLAPVGGSATAASNVGNFTINSDSNSAGSDGGINFQIRGSPVGQFNNAGDFALLSGTASTNSTSGALKVTGGVGVSGAINAGTTISAGTSVTSPIIYGSSASGGTLTLHSTSDSTKGNILINPAGGNVGIGTTSPNSASGTTLHAYNAANTGDVDSNSTILAESVNR